MLPLICRYIYAIINLIIAKGSFILKSFTIQKNDANQRLDKYLTKSFPNLPKALMYKYIRIKRIKVNGKRAEISTRLNLGDVVDMYINDEFFAQKETVYDFMSASKRLDIVYEDENVILLNKSLQFLRTATAAGIFHPPHDAGEESTLDEQMQTQLAQRSTVYPAQR